MRLKINLSVFLMAMAAIASSTWNRAYCQPGQWQTLTASTEDTYTAQRCDTVITRTYGSSISVACTRILNNSGNAVRHNFVLRCMDHGNYFQFDALKETKEPIAMGYIRTNYYIRDMRLSDSICFFCGTKVMTWIDTIALHPVSVYTMGFFGRFDISHVFRDSNAMYIPISPDPNQGPMYPVPVTEWGMNLQTVDIPQAASLNKLWVDDGLHVQGYKNAKYLGGSCPSAPPYTDVSSYYDPNFSINSAKAYMLGRWEDDPAKSCLIEVTGGLPINNTPLNYKVYTPSIPEEILTDVKGTDTRIIFSSRIYRDTALGDKQFKKDYTIGIRYKDNIDNDDDYLASIHLYSHENPQTGFKLGDEEYGHVCRLKDYKILMNQTEVYTEKDFGVVYSCSKYPTAYSPSTSKTFVLHVEKDLNVNVIFELGQYDNPPYMAGGLRIRDVAYIGNSSMNRIAIAYQPEMMGNSPYVELIDWGYMANGIDHLRFQSNIYDKSARLHTGGPVTSLDVFLDGRAFLMGQCPISNDPNSFCLATQRRSNVAGKENDVACRNAEIIKNQNRFYISHAELESPLIEIETGERPWIKSTPIATKSVVENNCTQLSKRGFDPTEDETEPETETNTNQ